MFAEILCLYEGIAAVGEEAWHCMALHGRVLRLLGQGKTCGWGRHGIAWRCMDGRCAYLGMVRPAEGQWAM
ncbi:MAG: hypothetical protein CFE21_03675 [Bacteroidetes bacterium B1(2017)]|nr:MAG: hypothetical protein CFE21_03675 [Bacteroidetes bacterium B1(2017)]